MSLPCMAWRQRGQSANYSHTCFVHVMDCENVIMNEGQRVGMCPRQKVSLSALLPEGVCVCSVCAHVRACVCVILQVITETYRAYIQRACEQNTQGNISNTHFVLGKGDFIDAALCPLLPPLSALLRDRPCTRPREKVTVNICCSLKINSLPQPLHSTPFSHFPLRLSFPRPLR